ncbi:hypothetical protein OCK02_10600 [Rhizobium sp. TRM96647]|uniref:hypothetical protein n=1 Tax=unclassified Rhizobium TaxID=2613769 RepID=UPI0021E76299|nr:MULTISPECIES: hypothetical protein [unclassified Rhizobium]MCV3736655.1 hypothetical protein [Rhizobium sp. TRM96647]MCV3759024.1 hypothetical protein [Rhizobium sp. TRM96650]
MPSNTVPEFFVAARNDGLGERLRSVLNAMLLAKIHNKKFLFSWPIREDMHESHAIEPADKMFSCEFLQSNFIGKVGVVENRHVFGEVVTIKHDEALFPAVSVTQVDLPKNILIDSDSNFRLLFEEIGFSDKNRLAINAAHSVDIGEAAVAIHMRAGDIVFGRYRFEYGRFIGKTVPFSIASGLIKSLIAHGKNVLLFGQDGELCRLLSERYGARFVGDIVDQHNFDQTQSALFEIVLMARCRAIYAGNSGFALLASRISGVDLTEAHRHLSASDINLFTSEEMNLPYISSISPLQRAYARWYRLYYCWKEMSLSEKCFELEQSLQDDPGNGLYQLMYAYAYFEAKDEKACEEIISDSLKKDISSFKNRRTIGKFRHVIEMQPQPGRLLCLPYIENIAKAASEDFPYSAYVAAIAYSQIGRNEEAVSMYKKYFNSTHITREGDDAILISYARKVIGLGDV